MAVKFSGNQQHVIGHHHHYQQQHKHVTHGRSVAIKSNHLYMHDYPMQQPALAQHITLQLARIKCNFLLLYQAISCICTVKSQFSVSACGQYFLFF
jgi:hypothetical protein